MACLQLDLYQIFEKQSILFNELQFTIPIHLGVGLLLRTPFHSFYFFTHLLAASRAVFEERRGGQELLKVPQRSPDRVRHDPQHTLQALLRGGAG